MQQTSESLEERLSQYTSYESTPDEALALFAEARAAGCPVAHSEKLDGHYLFLDYDDVRDAHRNWETFASSPQVLRPIVERPPFPPLEYDPPEQKQWRDLFHKALNVHTPKLHVDAVRAHVDELIEQARGQESFDVVEFCEEIALFTLCRVFGFDAEKRREVRRHTIEMHKHADDPVKGPAAFQAFAEFGVAEVMARLEDPRDDYLTFLSTATIDGRPLTPMELGGAMNSLLNAGHGTAVAGMTSLIHDVWTRPEVLERLVADRSLVPNAIEETLRLHTPFFGLYRRVTRDVAVGGVDLAEGDSAFMCWAAANRDPKAFERPDEFDLDRKRGAKRMLTFGFGIHACQGRPIAQMEHEVMLEQLLEHAPDLELIDPDEARYTFGGSETASIKELRARIPAR
jgi:cytochrome P450